MPSSPAVKLPTVASPFTVRFAGVPVSPGLSGSAAFPMITFNPVTSVESSLLIMDPSLCLTVVTFTSEYSRVTLITSSMVVVAVFSVVVVVVVIAASPSPDCTTVTLGLGLGSVSTSSISRTIFAPLMLPFAVMSPVTVASPLTFKSALPPSPVVPTVTAPFKLDVPVTVIVSTLRLGLTDTPFPSTVMPLPSFTDIAGVSPVPIFIPFPAVYVVFVSVALIVIAFVSVSWLICTYSPATNDASDTVM